MSDESKSVDRGYDALARENTRLVGENARKNDRLKALQAQLANVPALEKQVADLTAEVETWKAKGEAGPKELLDKVADLEGKLLSRDHRDAFAGVKEFTVKDKDGKDTSYKLRDGVTVDTLWRNIDYKPEGETPDVAKITDLLGNTVASHGFLYSPAEESSAAEPHGSKPAPIMTPASRPGPGASRVDKPAPGAPPSVGATVAAAYAATGRKQPGRL